MPTTSNFGWTTPADTDLVKDGAAAIRTLGNGIDTSLIDLKGGTTGQILSKASNTDLDYSWIDNDQGDITAVTAGIGISGGGTAGAVTITNSMATAIDAKGDLVAGTGADTFARLAVGTNGQVLSADSSTATGLKWIAAAASSPILQIVYASYGTTVTNTSNTTYVDTGLTATITPTSASSTILCIFNHNALYRDTTSKQLQMRFFRGATEIYTDTKLFQSTNTFGWEDGSTVILKDSPATTSATTYKTDFKCSASGGSISVQADNRASSLTLIELSA